MNFDSKFGLILRERFKKPSSGHNLKNRNSEVGESQRYRFPCNCKPPQEFADVLGRGNGSLSHYYQDLKAKKTSTADICVI